MNKNRFVRLVALAGCSALIGAFGYVPGASAHIGASHAPFSTTDPDLLTATIDSFGQVRACFDENINTIVAAPELRMTGYDSSLSDPGAGGSTTIDPTDNKCVLSDYSDNPSFDQMSIFQAEEGAVADSTGNENTNGAVGLAGTDLAPRLGQSDAPDVLEAVIQPGPNRIVYTLDEPVNGATCEGSNFGFEQGNGDNNFGDPGLCFAVSGSTVTVHFAADVEGAVRFFVETDSGACGDLPGIFDPGTDAGNSQAKFNTFWGAGAPTADPDLTSVTAVGNNTLAYKFDENVVVFFTDCFIAHGEDGDVYNGDTATQPTADTVNVSFFDVNLALEELVSAGAEDCAVNDTTPVTPDCNSHGSIGLQAAPIQPGFSDGPDLEQAITDVPNDTVDYCHDEALNTDTAQISPSEFFVIDNAGTQSFGIGVVGIVDNCLEIAFSAGDVDLAVAAGLDEDTGGAPDRLEGPDVVNPHSQEPNLFGTEGNESIDAAAVAVNGPPPGGTLPGPPGPPAPPTTPTPPPGTPPGGITVRTGLCDPSRPTAPLDELVIGGSGPDLICGFGGDDSLRGDNGADTLKGNQGNDVHSGGAGKDNIRGGSGKDLMRGSKGADTLKGGSGVDTARGARGNDLCRAETERGCEK